MKRILITGAAGKIGSVPRRDLRGGYALIRLLGVAPLGQAEAGEELCLSDIRDLVGLERAMAGIDCVVHLAGVPDEAAWEPVRSLNIDGCYNVFEAALRQGVKRIVFVSSNHAVGFYRREQLIGTDVPARPDTRYGVSKVFGETPGRLYADKYGASVACLRIGSFRTPDRPTEPRHLLTWISHRDTVQLVRRCIDRANNRFVVVYGVSNKSRRLWGNSSAAFLGYRPEDDAETFATESLARGGEPDGVAATFHGGVNCAMEMTRDPLEIDRMRTRRL